MTTYAYHRFLHLYIYIPMIGIGNYDWKRVDLLGQNVFQVLARREVSQLLGRKY